MTPSDMYWGIYVAVVIILMFIYFVSSEKEE